MNSSPIVNGSEPEPSPTVVANSVSEVESHDNQAFDTPQAFPPTATVEASASGPPVDADLPLKEKLIAKASKSHDARWLAAQLRHRGFSRDVAGEVAQDYATRSGDSVELVIELLDKEYRKPAASSPNTRIPMVVPVFKTITLHETFNKRFPPEEWVIEPMLPTGTSLLSADPKSGKSYFCLQIAVCVTQNKRFLGHYKVKRPGPVLYLALEDGERRIYWRMREMGMSDQNLDNVKMVYDIDFERSLSTAEGRAAIKQELQRQKDTGNPYVLMVVDTLAAACSELAGGSDVFRKQYQEMKQFQDIALGYNLAALISTHNKKGEAKGALEKMGGTYGRAAAVNGNMILEKRSDRTVLQIRSRDTEDADIALKWNGKNVGWGLMTETEVQQKDKNWEIYQLVNSHGPIGSTRVAELLDRERTTTANRMRDMCKAGELIYDKDKKLYTVALPKLAPDQPEDGFMS